MHEFSTEIIDRLSSDDFLRLPLDGQFSFLDLVRSRYESTSHPSAPSVAQAIQRVFQAHLTNPQVPFSRLCKTYDLAYFLYWCAAVSIEQQRGFDTGVVVPFSRYLKPRAGRERPLDCLQGNKKIRLCYLAQFAYDG